MENFQALTTPFDKIALSLSGGGYRAASFHLGSMSFLNEVFYNGKPLLENVRMISTVSGGTITGVVYALGKQNGKSFNHILNYLVGKLSEIDLISEGLLKLNPEAEWENKLKRKNLINAFAELYDHHFTEGKTLGDIQKPGHLDNFVFNSTEFNNAVNFRFRNKSAGFSGNYYCRLTESAASEIKLCDVMAASSCFPGGFEPLIWPNDFIHTNSPLLAKLAESTPPMGIMDGGIYDNQGIDSILNYKSDKKKPPHFDLVIISDVASPDMTPYKPFPNKPKTKGFFSKTVGELKKDLHTLRKKLTFWILTVTAACLLPPVFWCYNNTFATGLFSGLALATILIFFAKHLAFNKAEKFYRDGISYVRENYKGFYLDKISALNIDQISLHRAQPLVIDRLNSLITLLMDVFLKVVRRLNYSRLYNDEQYRYRRISNLIKELTKEDFEGKRSKPTEKTSDGNPGEQKKADSFNGDYQQVIGEKIQQVADRASKFGTTLWFTDENKDNKLLLDLLATGQFTMCYNLITYLEEIIDINDSGYAAFTTKQQNDLKETYRQCKDHWSKFFDNPHYLISHLKPVNEPDLI